MAEKIIYDVEVNLGESNKEVERLTDNITELETANKRLRTEQNKQSKETKEGIDQRKVLGRQIEANKDALKRNRNERTQNIKAITGEKSAFDKLTDAVKEGNKTQQSQLDKLEQMPGAAGGFVSGMKGMTSAAKKFLLNPIGLVLAGIVGVLALLKKSFNRNEEAQNRMSVVTSKLAGVFNFLLKALEPLVKFLIDKVATAFETVGKVADGAIKLLSKGLKLLGFEEAAENVDVFVKKLDDVVKKTTELTKAQNELRKELRLQEKVQLDFQKLAERQRQIRDDEALSIKQRIAANKELGKVLAEQTKEELRIANLALKVANLRIEAEGEFDDSLNQRAEALIKIAEVEERIESQTSEQLVNINSLRKEAAEQQKARNDEYVSDWEETQKEIDDLEDEAFGEDLKRKDEENETLTKKTEAQRIKETEDLIAFNEEQRELFQESLNDSFNSVVENADERFLIAQKLTNSLLDLQKKVKDGEKVTAKDISAIALGVASDIIAARRKVKDAEIAELTASSDRRIQERADVIANFEGTEAEKADLQRQFDELDKQSRERLAKQKYDLEVKQFKTDKVLAIVNAGINTAVAVTKLLAIPPLAIAAGVSGAASIALIATKKPPPPPSFGRGGGVKMAKVGGRLHSQGGVDLRGTDGTHVNVERGEGLFVTKRGGATEKALARINKEHGGRGLSGSKRRFLQDGGSAQLGGGDIGLIMERVIKAIPDTINVKDIITGVEKRSVTVNNGNIG